MRDEEGDIYHQDTTIHSNEDSPTQLMVSQFTAPTEAIVGWHVFRARIPGCGISRGG